MAGLHRSYAFGAHRVAVFRDDDSTLQPAAKNRLDPIVSTPPFLWMACCIALPPFTASSACFNIRIRS
jgi:hypothetical protein